MLCITHLIRLPGLQNTLGLAIELDFWIAGLERFDLARVRMRLVEIGSENEE